LSQHTTQTIFASTNTKALPRTATKKIKIDRGTLTAKASDAHLTESADMV